MSNPVTVAEQGDVSVITVDNPPVNALGHAVRTGLEEAFAAANASASTRAIVLSCAGRTFMAGADIREFGKPLQPPSLPDVVYAIESSAKPVVAAIHGTALGGGLETAMGCHYRVALADAKVGLPEVKLGILPGAGGTQRTPRLMGAEAALDLMVSGEHMVASEAHAAGLVDEVVDGDLVDAALAAARRLADAGGEPRRARDLDAPSIDAAFFGEYRKRMARRTRGQFAPERIVRSVENALALPFDEGIAAERALFDECMASPQSGAMRHVFFAEREVARVPGISRDVKPRRLRRIGVVGAGTMGGGIAMNFANVGLPVTLLETDDAALERGLGVIRANYERSVASGRLAADELDARMARLEGTLDYAALGDADLVIEAAFETMDVKKAVFAELDKACKPGAILATNTSTLDVDEIAATTSRPSDVLGLHFFSPANVMRLLEVVRGRETAPDVLATAMQMARRIGKVGVVSGVCWGFIGNRMLEGYLREASFLLLEGASPAAIDKAIYEFGFAMGPHAMMDLAGQDVGAKIRVERRAAGTLPDDPRYGLVGDRLAEMGRHGQKTGAGIYRYEAGSRTPAEDPEVASMIAAEARRLGIEQRDVGEQEIIERCLYPLINEGAFILDEGIALRPSDIDVVWLNGYGFPVWRGGPMCHADSIGLARIATRLRDFSKKHPSEHGYWKVSPLLDELGNTDSTFADWQRAHR